MVEMAGVDVGSGPPLVLIPGAQGRWEYVAPAIEALARSFRVLSFSLCGERKAARFDPQLGLDNYVNQVAAVLDRAAVHEAIVCGVSFGGLVAVRFAATHPERTRALVIVSAPGSGWHPARRHRLYMRAPWLFAPLFLLESPRRLYAEVLTAFPTVSARCRFALWQLKTLIRFPLSPSRMATRAALIPSAPILDDCARISAPTLVVVGEPGLDHVVPVGTTTPYTRLIANARCETLDQTGHLGSITAPDRFAALVHDFGASVGEQVGSQPTKVHEAPGTRRGHALA
jgi:pimeloyl-ACP methyl ester carboxylesterase